MKAIAIVTIIGALSVQTAGAADAMRGPWPPPTIPARADEGGFAFPGGVLDQWIALFQKTVSRVDGDRCPMTPVCSVYGRIAIARYGPFVGTMMIVDRLFHESGLEGEVPLVPAGNGQLRWFDPVEENVLGEVRR